MLSVKSASNANRYIIVQFFPSEILNDSSIQGFIFFDVEPFTYAIATIMRL